MVVAVERHAVVAAVSVEGRVEGVGSAAADLGELARCAAASEPVEVVQLGRRSLDGGQLDALAGRVGVAQAGDRQLWRGRILRQLGEVADEGAVLDRAAADGRAAERRPGDLEADSVEAHRGEEPVEVRVRGHAHLRADGQRLRSVELHLRQPEGTVVEDLQRTGTADAQQSPGQSVALEDPGRDLLARPACPDEVGVLRLRQQPARCARLAPDGVEGGVEPFRDLHLRLRLGVQQDVAGVALDLAAVAAVVVQAHGQSAVGPRGRDRVNVTGREHVPRLGREGRAGQRRRHRGGQQSRDCDQEFSHWRDTIKNET